MTNQTTDRTLLIHVPKTGGTTLDAVLAAGRPQQICARAIQFTSEPSEFGRINESTTRYVSGHFPHALVEGPAFARKFTLIRDPLAIISSMFNFARVLGRDGMADLSALCDPPGKLQIYSPYFAPRFDRMRFDIERRYGLAPNYTRYIDPHSVEDVVATIAAFDHVLDFEQIVDEIARLVIDDRLFPFSSVPRLRSYAYAADLQEAMPFLTDFDRQVFDQCREHILRPVGDTRRAYASYRAAYCQSDGIALDVRASMEIDLRKPIGLGWHDAELSDLGRFFRWSENQTPTIEIPIAEVGTYAFYVYLQLAGPTYVEARAGLEAGGTRDHEYNDEVADVVCLHWTAYVPHPDWMQVQMRFNPASDSASDSATTADERVLGVVLGCIYLRRLS